MSIIKYLCINKLYLKVRSIEDNDIILNKSVIII